jgi:hypothetical protein
VIAGPMTAWVVPVERIALRALSRSLHDFNFDSG